MAYDLIPTREVSGGPWYTDQEFDHEFVEAIKKFIVKYVTEMKLATMEEIHAALAKVGISSVPLAIEDVRLVVDTLLCDSKLEEMKVRSSTSSGYRYKIAKSAVDVSWVPEVPCGTCPWPRCSPDGRHTPACCQYLEKWLEQDAMDE